MDSQEYSLCVSPDSIAEMLIRIDYTEGIMEYRESNNWIQVGPEDDFPWLSLSYLDATPDVVEMWDRNGPQSPLTDFSGVMLDGI